MTSTPKSIQPLLTTELSLRCELTKKTVLNNVHASHSHHCNVTTTSDEIDFISSIFIMKDTGEDIASVSIEHQQPKALSGDVTDVEITGNLTPNGDVEG